MQEDFLAITQSIRVYLLNIKQLENHPPSTLFPMRMENILAP